MKSIRHLVALCGASGVICLTVLATDASRVWFAAGPSLLAILDAAAFSAHGRRAARHLSPVPLTRLHRRSSLLADAASAVVLGVVASVLAFLSPWPWAAAVVALLAATVLIHDGLVAFRLRHAPRAEGAPRGPVIIRGPVTISGTGRDVVVTGVAAPRAPAAAMLARMLASTAAARLVILALLLPDALDPMFETWLDAARETALYASRQEGADPIFCEIGAAGPGLIVAADSQTRSVLLALLHSGPPFPVLVGTATYPDDADSPGALITAALARAAPLRNDG